MRATLLLLLGAAACAHPSFRASKVVELTLPADGLTALDCESHNGAIRVTGDAAAAAVALRAELSVRGVTQEEADANLELLAIAHERDGGTLRVRGDYPRDRLANRSPSFAFTLTVPPRTGVRLVSHNGDLHAAGIEGNAALETHNGDVDATLRTNRLAVASHNGDVDLRVDGAGALDGTVASHNGDVTLTLAGTIGTRVEAATHNGRVTPPANAADATSGRRRFAGRLGDGAGRLLVETHNGDVVIR
jgi:hypothetical protein